MVKRGDSGLEVFLKRLNDESNQLARIHSIWGLGQLGRQKIGIIEKIKPYLNDQDEEIVTQAIKIIGDVKYQIKSDDLIPFLKHKSLRIQLHAIEAIGRIKLKNAVNDIIENIRINNNKDLLLRHAAIIALSRVASPEELAKYYNDDSDAVKIACVVALRRLNSPLIDIYLKDKNEFIVTEASRAINDDYSIEESLPTLANLINKTEFDNEGFIRRSLNANSRVGKLNNIQNLIDFSTNSTNDELMRVESINILSNWESPSKHDRVDGRYRGEINRNNNSVRKLFGQNAFELLYDKSESVRVASIKALSSLKITSLDTILISFLKKDSSKYIRQQSLITLLENNSYNSEIIFDIASNDTSKIVRTELLKHISKTLLQDETKASFLINIYKKGSYEEKQESINQLKLINNDQTKFFFSGLKDSLINQTILPEISLEVFESFEYFPNLKLKFEKTFSDTLTPYYYTLLGVMKKKELIFIITIFQLSVLDVMLLVEIIKT